MQGRPSANHERLERIDAIRERLEIGRCGIAAELTRTGAPNAPCDG
jgi:hypothetical protein